MKKFQSFQLQFTPINKNKNNNNNNNSNDKRQFIKSLRLCRNLKIISKYILKNVSIKIVGMMKLTVYIYCILSAFLKFTR